MRAVVERAMDDAQPAPGRVSIVCARCGQSYFT
jgi:hypothetical protein